jgi:hypothetical protein
MPLCPRMLDGEAIVLSGTEVFSKVTGYAARLKFAGPLTDSTPRVRDVLLAAPPEGRAAVDTFASAVVDADAGPGGAEQPDCASGAGTAEVVTASSTPQNSSVVAGSPVLDPDSLLSCIVAIDAVCFHRRDLRQQLGDRAFTRDLVKVCQGCQRSARQTVPVLFASSSVAGVRWVLGGFC